MADNDTMRTPREHTPNGGVLEGYASAPQRLVVYEDPQCPYCAKFERANAELLRQEIVAGTLAVEYRMRAVLGPESVRANNALALAAESRHFDDLRTELFANQPEEGTGGFTIADLLGAGQRAGITDEAFASGVHEGRYHHWVQATESEFQAEDPDGTPVLYLDGQRVDDTAVYASVALKALLRGQQ